MTAAYGIRGISNWLYTKRLQYVFSSIGVPCYRYDICILLLLNCVGTDRPILVDIVHKAFTRLNCLQLKKLIIFCSWLGPISVDYSIGHGSNTSGVVLARKQKCPQQMCRSCVGR